MMRDPSAACRQSWIYHGGVVASATNCSGNRFNLGILCAIGHEEDVRQRVFERSVADAGDRRVSSMKEQYRYACRRSEARIRIGVKLRGKVFGRVVDSRGVLGLRLILAVSA